MPPSPHDALFKATFGRPDIAKSELELVLPAEVRAVLDLVTLEVQPGSFVDEALQHTHTDLLYAIRTADGQRDALVYVVFEHQSSPDATMPFRLLRYLVRVWERWLRDHPETTKLPIILPVLLHHGDGRWRAAPELASMFDASHELLDAVRPYQPHFQFILDDLAGLSPEVLATRALHALGAWSSWVSGPRVRWSAWPTWPRSWGPSRAPWSATPVPARCSSSSTPTSGVLPRWTLPPTRFVVSFS